MSAQAEKYKNMGNEEFKKGNHAKAIEYYTYATEMDPKNPIFYTNRSTAYFKMKQFEKSLRDAKKSIKNDPKWAKGYYRMGMALMELDQAEEAMKSFKEATDALAASGGSAAMMEDFARETLRAKSAMLKGKSQAEILKLDGNELFKNGKIDDAVKAYTKALKLAKADELDCKADILANRAACNRQLYEPDRVIADCSEALQYNAKHVKALIRRAQAYESIEKYKKALADFELASQLAPNTQVAYSGSSRIRQAMKKLGIM